MGLRPGDHVAILMENHERYFEVFWGAQRIGLSTTPINWHLKADEAGYIIEDCGAVAVVTSARLSALGGAARAVPRQRAPPPDGRRHGARLDSRTRRRPPSTRPSRSSTRSRAHACSTRRARPGGRRASCRAIVRCVRRGWRHARSADPSDVRLRPAHRLPLPCPAVPRRTVRLVDDRPAPRRHRRGDGDASTPSSTLQLIERHRVTHAQFVPTQFVRMLKLPDESAAATTCPASQIVMHAAAPCPVEVKQQMLDWWGPIIHEYYAGSEGNGFCAIGPRGVAGPSRLGRHARSSASRAHRRRGR